MKNRIKKCKNVYDQAIKKSKFNLVVEYLIWVSINRTLSGKLEVGISFTVLSLEKTYRVSLKKVGIRISNVLCPFFYFDEFLGKIFISSEN